MERKIVKGLLEMSSSTKEANGYLEEYTGIKRTPEKIAYLRGMFDIQLGPRKFGSEVSEEKVIQDDYLACLSAVINKNRR